MPDKPTYEDLEKLVLRMRSHIRYLEKKDAMLQVACAVVSGFWSNDKLLNKVAGDVTCTVDVEDVAWNAVRQARAVVQRLEEE